MEYHKTITLKDGRACTLRNGTAEDGQALLKIFNLTHMRWPFWTVHRCVSNARELWLKTRSG